MKNVKIKLNNVDKIIDRQGFGEKLNLEMAQAAYRIMIPWVPMDTGMLYQTVNITSDDEAGYIEYKQPYAEKMFEGINPDTGRPYHYSTDNHPLATSHWDEAAMIAKGDELTKEVSAYRLRICRGG